ncbi:MAG: ABC transporter permease subunit [Desulfovibrionaceae bacterium]|jgi:ABC-2 type transport system permease protein|nr:ABC transporter permease subunit [Desulfovibrionaceae bacterium]
MSAAVLVARKDLMILFRSPLAYVVLAAFLALGGYFFASSVGYFELVSIQLMQNPEAMSLTPTQMVVTPYLQNAAVVLLFFLPLLTMRGFAEEKRMGTFEVLMSYPMNEAQIVGGKLLGLAVFLAAMLAAGALNPALLSLFTQVEPLPVLVGYLGLFLMGAGFLSLGLFLSSLTESQMVSGVLTFVALLLLWLLSWVRDVVPPALAPVVTGLSPLGHFEPFAKGVVQLDAVVYYATFVLAFFWLTVLSLENQRWRA